MQNPIKYQYVDAMRGIAILMVIMLHMSWSVDALYPLNTTLRLIANYCQMGVQLFFVASAYTLSMSYTKRSGEPHNIISFYIRRVFRIAPLYYLGIVTYFLLKVIIEIKHGNVAIAFESYNVKNILANMFLVHGFFPTAMNSIVHGGWSIGTEMIFYLIFPLLFLGSKKLTSSTALSTFILFLFAIAINILIQRWLSEFLHQNIVRNNFIYFSIFNQLPVFILGMLAYFLFDELQINEKFRFSLKFYIVGLIFFTGIALTLWVSKNQFYFAFIPIFSGISFVFLLGGLKHFQTSYDILAKIGVVSFSMYIFHFVFAWHVIPAILKRLNLTLDANIILLFAFLVCAASSYFVAHFTARVVETRGVLIGAKIISHLHIKAKD